MPMVCLLLVLGICGISFIVSMIRPAGVVGNSRMVMDRATGELFVNVEGRLHPALNLASARLITGMAENPTAVKTDSIAEYPQGALVGIPGAPESMPVTNGSSVNIAVCQRVSSHSASGNPVVTVINGGVEPGQTAGPLADTEAIVGKLNGETYVVWNGVKSRVDPNDRIVLAALGIDRATVTTALPLTRAVGNAIPSGLPMMVPAVPDFGQESPWDIGVKAPIGSVVRADIAGQGERFVLVLRSGLQQIPDTAAAMLRSVNAFGLATPPLVAPDKLAEIPQVTIVQVSQYPDRPLTVVNPKERPVSCWQWTKGREATASEQRVLVGTELPLAAGSAHRLVEVVGTHKRSAGVDAVFMAPDAANYIATTGHSGTSATAESWWWISPAGTRFGLSNSAEERQALGLGDDALPMPWVIAQLFPPGLGPDMALTKADAMTQHSNLPSDPAPAAVLPAR